MLKAGLSTTMGVIYCHINKINGKVYIGQTWRTLHKRKLDTYKCSPHFNRALQKYGWDNFESRVVAKTDTQAKLDNLEKVWIILLQARNGEFGYNVKEGGSHGRHSPESRAKMKVSNNPLRSKESNLKRSIALLGHKQSKETCFKKSRALKGNTRTLGLKHSEESKKKMREARLAQVQRMRED